MSISPKALSSFVAGASALLLGAGGLAAQASIPWPLAPGDVTYPIGNNYGEYQNYEGRPYYHDGIDILVTSPQEVVAVEDGTVVAMTSDSEYYSCVIVGEPVEGGRGYVYEHLAKGSLKVKPGDKVKKGARLGEVGPFMPSEFRHLHFSRVEGIGHPAWGEAYPIDNPILYLTPNSDSSAPVFEQASSDGPFLFCANSDGDTCPRPTELKGQLDIIVLVYDTFNSDTWHLAPYKLIVEVSRKSDGQQVYRSELVLDGELGEDPFPVQTLYKGDAVAQSEGDYQSRKFYLIATNMDETRRIDHDDEAQAWDTTQHGDGLYEVKVTASDHAGNSTTATMTVTVDNHQ